MRTFFRRIAEKAIDHASAPVVTVAFGDSVTQGAFECGVLRPDLVYHRLLQRELEALFPGSTFSTINSGVGGSWARQSMDRLDRDVIRYRPDLVLIAFGLNDAAGGWDEFAGFEMALREMVHTIRHKTEADIVFVTPPMMARARSSRIHPNEMRFAENILATQNNGILASFAEAMRRVAEELSLPVADVHRKWEELAACGLDTDTLLSNGLNHPDERGHRLAAGIILDALIAAGGEEFDRADISRDAIRVRGVRQVPVGGLSSPLLAAKYQNTD